MAEEINEPEEMFQSWDGKPIYAKKAERDVNGNPLALTIENDKVTAIGGVSVGGGGGSDPESASLPVATESDSVLFTAEPNGEAAWVQMEKTVYGSIMTDEEGTPILDEEGKTIQDEDTATLWTGFNGKGFGAERAAADENGNNIVATYATKTDVETALGDIETLLAAI